LKEITCLRSRTVSLHPDSGRVTGYPEVTPGQKFGSGRGVMPSGHHQASDLGETISGALPSLVKSDWVRERDRLSCSASQHEQTSGLKA